MNVERAFSSVRERVKTAVATTVPIPDPREIVARGRRRRTRRIIVAGLTVVAVILGGYSLIGSPVAVVPAPEPAASTSATTFTPPSRVREDLSGRIPAGFLIHEEKSDEPANSPAIVHGVCFNPPRQSVGVAHTVGEGAGAVTISQHLYVYPTDALAKQVMDNVRRVQLRNCFGFPDARVLKNDTPKWGDEAVGQTVALPADGAGEHTGEPVRMVVLRVGRAVTHFWGYPEIPEIDQDAQAMVRRMCFQYSSDCAAPMNRPDPVRKLTDGGRVWVAALDAYYDDDRLARPGAAMAAAADRGYLASSVPVECDQGAGQALAMSGHDARYVAVYFNSRAEAESLQPALGAFEVRTWCVA